MTETDLTNNVSKSLAAGKRTGTDGNAQDAPGKASKCMGIGPAMHGDVGDSYEALIRHVIHQVIPELDSY